MQGKYWHSECAGCASYGIECAHPVANIATIPTPAKSFTPIIDEYSEEYPEYCDEEY